MFDQRSDAEPKSNVEFEEGRTFPVIVKGPVIFARVDVLVTVILENVAVPVPVIVGDAIFGVEINELAESAVTATDVLKPKCLTCTFESAGGAEVNVIVVPDVV